VLGESVCGVCVSVSLQPPTTESQPFAFLIALTSCQVATFFSIFFLVEGCDRLVDPTPDI